MPNPANVPADIKKIQTDEATLAADTATLAADAAASVTPTPPTTVGASTLTAAVSGTSVALSATAATNATGYNFYRDSAAIESGASRQFTDTNVAAGIHSYQVEPFAGNVSGPYSSTVKVTVASPSGTLPIYAPPGGVGSLLFDCDFSTLTNQSGAGPMFASTTGSTNNDMKASASDVAIVNGQLVLTNSSNGVGGQVSTCPTSDGSYPTPSNGGFNFIYGYVEVSYVEPAGGWWAIWLSGGPWPTHGEFDIAENLGSGPTTNYHGTGSSAVQNGGTWPTEPSSGSTVVVGGLWEAGQVISYCNGVQQKTLSNGGGNGITIGSKEEFILLTMGQGSGTGYTLKVNSVKVWALP